MGIQSDIRNVFKPQSASDRKTKEYLISASLGRGSFGQVYEARWKPASGGTKQVALKIIQKQTVSEEYFDFKEEMDILKSLNHANIVHLWDHFETPDHYFFALELATGGDVYQYIKRRGKFTESNAQSIIRQVLSGVAYLHANNIIHRDIKPENILFLNQTPDSPIVIADFGTAKRLEDDSEEMAEVCGSFYYLSPEVMAGRTYGIKVDIWAIGTMCFIFLCGYPPYRGDTVNDRDFAMNKGSLKFHTDFWKRVSPLAQEFCKYLLTVDPLYRPTAQEALDHPWIGGNVQSEHDLSRTIMDNIDSKSIWRKTLNVVTASTRLMGLPISSRDTSPSRKTKEPSPTEQLDSDGESFVTASEHDSLGPHTPERTNNHTAESPINIRTSEGESPDRQVRGKSALTRHVKGLPVTPALNGFKEMMGKLKF